MEISDKPIYGELESQLSAQALSALLKVSSSLASTLDLAEILQIAIESAVQLFGVHSGAIYTLEEGWLYLGATIPPLPPLFPEELRKSNLDHHAHIRKAISSKEPIYLEDARTASLTPEERTVVESRQLVTILYFPLLQKGEAIGTFILGTTGETHQFSKEEIDLGYILSFQVSLAIANARLFAEAQQAISDLNLAYTATLEGWSQLLDMTDQITDEHTHRVADLTVALASRLGVPEADLVNYYRGALLHDIGKMGIPGTILQKPGPLDEAEWEIMRTHPERAYRVLAGVDFLTDALAIPYCHHEKWDGSGYPRKLAGEEIPIEARIFSVVDVYDALMSDRPYRQAWESEKVLNYMASQSGKYFDPEVVEVFLEMIQEMDAQA